MLEVRADLVCERVAGAATAVRSRVAALDDEAGLVAVERQTVEEAGAAEEDEAVYRLRRVRDVQRKDDVALSCLQRSGVRLAGIGDRFRALREALRRIATLHRRELFARACTARGTRSRCRARGSRCCAGVALAAAATSCREEGKAHRRGNEGRNRWSVEEGEERVEWRGLSLYSKMELTTSSSVRCTSRSSVSDQTTADWQASRGRDALADQLAGVGQQTRADALGQAVLAQVAHLLAQAGQVVGHALVDTAASWAMISALLLARRVVELDRDEALAGAVLEVLEGALVARVVGDDQQEALGRLQHLRALLQRQQAAVVGQGVDEDGGVLARLDDLVQVADGAGLDRTRQRAVDPARRLALEQVAADEVAGREVFVTGDGDDGQSLVEATAVRGRAVVSIDHRLAETPGHVFDEAGLAAARRALEQHRDALFEGRGEHLDLVGDREVVGLYVRLVLLDGVLAVA